MKKPLSDKDTLAAEVERSSAIAGKPGKYISMENGLSAVRLPKIRIKEIYLDLVIQMRIQLVKCSQSLYQLQISYNIYKIFMRASCSVLPKK
jgi:hypothetical protein